MSSSYLLPNVFVDIVVFSFINGKLHVLLHKRNKSPEYGKYALPGGQIHADKDKDLEVTARRVFKQKVGGNLRYLEQLKSFGSADRDERGWSVSVSYLGLVEHYDSTVLNDSLFVSVEEELLKELPFDHFEIIQEALARVKNKASYSTLPVFFLGQNFTLVELREVYEYLFRVSLNPSAFRRKIFSQDIIERVDFEEVSNNKKGRPAELYRMKSDQLHDMGRVIMLPDERRGG